jgi:hypothetical protein
MSFAVTQRTTTGKKTSSLFVQTIPKFLSPFLQVFITYTPAVNRFFYVSGMDGEVWGRVVGLSFFIFFLIEAEKLLGLKYGVPLLRDRAGLKGLTRWVKVYVPSSEDDNSTRATRAKTPEHSAAPKVAPL